MFRAIFEAPMTRPESSWTAPDAREDHVFFALSIGRNDDADRLPDDFRGGVPEHAFGGAVPGRDDAVQILADDGIV